MRNIIGMFGIFSWSFAATSNTIVSNIIGQGRSDEVLPLVRRIAGISLGFAFLVFCILLLAPEWFLSFYGRGDDFISYAIPVVRVVAVALLMMAYSTVWLNAVTGTGNTRVNLLIESFTLVIYCVYVYVVLEYLHLPITWGWFSECVYWLFMFLLSWTYMRSGNWRGKQI